jgi:hypothetical protein
MAASKLISIALLAAVAVVSAQDDYVRVKRESVKMYELNDKINTMASQLENSISTDTLGAVISQSIETAFAKSTIMSEMVDEIKGYQASYDAQLQEQTNAISGKLSKMSDDLDNALQGIKDAQADNDKKTDDAVAAIDQKLEESKAEILAAVDKKITSTIAITNKLQTTYLSNPKIPVFKMAKFHTYSWGSPWMDNNNRNYFGMIHPSTWSDGNGMVSNMDWSPSVLRKIFHTHGTGDVSGLNACAEAYPQRTSTNGYMCIVMFRIKNTKSQAIGFSTAWRYTSDEGWSERASVALNKQNVWHGHCSHQGYCERTISVNIPGGKTSTLIFAASSMGRHCSYGACYRSTYNAFRELKLADGLEFVDDLDTTTSLV